MAASIKAAGYCGSGTAPHRAHHAAFRYVDVNACSSSTHRTLSLHATPPCTRRSARRPPPRWEASLGAARPSCRLAQVTAGRAASQSRCAGVSPRLRAKRTEKDARRARERLRAVQRSSKHLRSAHACASKLLMRGRTPEHAGRWSRRGSRAAHTAALRSWQRGACARVTGVGATVTHGNSLKRSAHR